MQKNENIKRKALQVLEKVTRHEAEKVVASWPPKCSTIYHQPKRPKNKMN